jgi:hypothetical protein
MLEGELVRGVRVHISILVAAAEGRPGARCSALESARSSGSFSRAHAVIDRTPTAEKVPCRTDGRKAACKDKFLRCIEWWSVRTGKDGEKRLDSLPGSDGSNCPAAVRTPKVVRDVVHDLEETCDAGAT